MDTSPDDLQPLYAQFSTSLQTIHEMSKRFSIPFSELNQAAKISFSFHLAMLSMSRAAIVMSNGKHILDQIIAAVLKEDFFAYNEYITINEKPVIELANKFETKFVKAVKASKDKSQANTSEKRVLDAEKLKGEGVF